MYVESVRLYGSPQWASLTQCKCSSLLCWWWCPIGGPYIAPSLACDYRSVRRTTPVRWMTWWMLCVALLWIKGLIITDDVWMRCTLGDIRGNSVNNWLMDRTIFTWTYPGRLVYFHHIAIGNSISFLLNGLVCFMVAYYVLVYNMSWLVL